MAEEAEVVNEAVEQPTTQTESTPVENTEVASESVEAPEQETDDSQGEEVTEEAESTEEESEDTDAPEEEAPAELPQKGKDANTRIRQLANENRQMRDYIAQIEELKANSEEDYVEAGYPQERAEILALKESVERDRAINQISQLNSGITSDVNRILQDFPEFNPTSSEFIGEEHAKELASLYDEYADVQYDKDGVVALSAKTLPYEFYKRQAKVIRAAKSKAGVQAQANAEKMLSSAEPQSRQTPVSTGNDFDDLKSRLENYTF